MVLVSDPTIDHAFSPLPQPIYDQMIVSFVVADNGDGDVATYIVECDNDQCLHTFNRRAAYR